MTDRIVFKDVLGGKSGVQETRTTDVKGTSLIHKPEGVSIVLENGTKRFYPHGAYFYYEKDFDTEIKIPDGGLVETVNVVGTDATADTQVTVNTTDSTTNLPISTAESAQLPEQKIVGADMTVLPSGDMSKMKELDLKEVKHMADEEKTETTEEEEKKEETPEDTPEESTEDTADEEKKEEEPEKSE